MKKSIFLFALFVLLVFCGCKLIPALPEIKSNDLSENQKLSLDSLRQIDAFPFYSMVFYGDADDAHLKSIRKIAGIKSNACSTFTAYTEKGEQILARNHDWPENPVLMVFSHPKGKLSSMSLVDLSMLGYTKKSRFDSAEDRAKLLYSLYIPIDGMNEKGLAIGAMGCMGIDSRNENPVVLSTEIIRIILDNAGNVNDAIDIFEKYSVKNIIVPLHYVISDSAGNSAIIEYIDGKVEVQELGTDVKALTNFKYYGSEGEIAKKYREYTESGKIANDVFGDSYLRYLRIKRKQTEAEGVLNEKESMSLLRDISMRKKSMYGDFYTVWSVVYNLSAKSVNVSIGRDYDTVYSFGLTP